MKNFRQPKSQKDIKLFLELVGYYIPDFDEISKPLTKVLQKDEQFGFTSDYTKSPFKTFFF